MAVIDERGRVFGRFNLLDAFVVLAIVMLVPLAYAAYRVFRVPQPVIDAVTPATLAFDAPRRVRLTGQHFRPYLGAYVAKADEAYSVVNRAQNTLRATFLIETPTTVELQFPPADPGTYDIHLYDESQEVAIKKAAFTIAPRSAGTVEALVRFVVPPETAALVAVGDRDRWEENGVAMLTPDQAATIESVRATGEAATITASTPPTPTTAPGTVLHATVRLTARQLALGGWEYKSQRVRAGETFIFETIRYRINGVVLRTTDLAAPKPAGGQ